MRIRTTERTRAWLAVGVAALAAGCMDPVDARPGLWLSGEPAASPPGDWSFTDAHPEIAIQVATPYLVPHSVTIWCVSVDGDLYVAARNPDEKRWTGWVDRDPEVRLGIGSTLYDARLVPLEEEDVLARVRAAYREKYDYPDRSAGAAPPMRYWSVRPS